MRMDLVDFFGHGYQLIGSLILLGASFLVISVALNRRIAMIVLKEEPHLEKIYEFYRNTLTQLGVLLIGIGVSLFIYFVQQNYENQRRRDAEIQQVLAKLQSRIGDAAATLESLPQQ